MRKKHHPRSKISNLYFLAILIFLTFVGYSSAPSLYKGTLLFLLILFITLFFIIFAAGVARKKRHDPNDKRPSAKRASRSFALLLTLMLVGGGIYLFWPSVTEIISKRVAQPQNTNVSNNPLTNIKIGFGHFDINTVITWIVTLLILAIIGYIVWENRFRLRAYAIRVVRPFETHYTWVPEFSWTPTAKMDSQFNYVWDSIKEFKPTKYCRNERDYQKELYGWLRPRFPDIRWEPPTGGIRPDLSIGKTAIELKAHANDGTLDSLSFKIITHPCYYEHLYIVIFGHHFRKRRFSEFKNGTRSRYPEVGVITKR